MRTIYSAYRVCQELASKDNNYLFTGVSNPNSHSTYRKLKKLLLFSLLKSMHSLENPNRG